MKGERGQPGAGWKLVFFGDAGNGGVWLCARHQIGRVALVAFGLSFGDESLQLFLHVGFFELIDLVMNTVGGRSWGGDECGGEKRERNLHYDLGF